MNYQKEILLKPYNRGFHLITDIIEENLDSVLDSVNVGLVQVFIKHTSASLTINENSDKSVRNDMELYYNEIASENKPYFTHIHEGDDDMPAHIKNSLLGSSITIPITNGKFNLGTWQGIYLCEHRNNGGQRKILLTVIGD